jgi:hypothetical protein
MLVQSVRGVGTGNRSSCIPLASVFAKLGRRCNANTKEAIMKYLSLFAITFWGLTAHRGRAAEFEAPYRLTADGTPIRVESPGYASPCRADIDNDGDQDLLVGQFSGGKIRVYKNIGEKELAAGEWLQADGKVAEVPGVW